MNDRIQAARESLELARHTEALMESPAWAAFEAVRDRYHQKLLKANPSDQDAVLTAHQMVVALRDLENEFFAQARARIVAEAVLEEEDTSNAV